MAITRARTSSVAQGPSTRKTVLGGNDVILPGSYDAIGTAVVGSGGQSTITFTSIPSTYKHLQLRGILKDTTTSFGAGLQATIRFNSDSTSGNYADHWLRGTGTVAQAGSDTISMTQMYIPYYTGSSSATNMFGGFVIDILDYADTNKNKTVRGLSGGDLNGTGYIGLTSGLYKATSAINAITIYPNVTAFAQYSQVDLYGIK